MRNPLGRRSAAADQREDAFFAIVNAEIFVWDAFQEALLKAGSIDVFPEYTGNLLQYCDADTTATDFLKRNDL